MDEVFHIPQAQAFCSSFPWLQETKWDPMITTLPGTYIGSVVALQGVGMSIVTGVFQTPGPTGGWCSAAMLRATNLVFVPLTIIALRRCMDAVRGTSSAASTASLWMEAGIVSTFPLLFFFNFLYYTDPGSTFFVIMCYAEARRQAPVKAALYGAVAVLFRQTNIVWVVFSAAVSLLALLDTSTAAALTEPPTRALKGSSGGEGEGTPENKGNARGLGSEIVLYVNVLASGGMWMPALRRLLPFLTVAAAFGCFLFINEGIVVGDRTAHKAVVHLPQLFYFAGFAAVFAAPHLWLGWGKLSGLAAAVKAKASTASGAAQMVAVAAVVVACIGRFTLAHKYLLADNRHFPFYVWRKVFMRHSLVKFALAPAYMLAGLQIGRMLRVTQRPIWVLGFAVACGLALVPAELLEFRYFLPPYLLLRTHLPPPSATTLLLEALMYTVVNGATIWLFLSKTFEWENHPGELQRFMW